jgi:formyl-CoA transferase
MVLIAANQDTVFSRLAQAMARPELAEDKRYKTHTARGDHQTELDDLIAEWSGSLTADELQKKLDEYSIPQGKIYRAPDMLEDPHFKAREAILKIAHPEFKNLHMQNVFPKFSKTKATVRSPGPELGANNDEIYKGLLGMSDVDISSYKDKGLI